MLDHEKFHYTFLMPLGGFGGLEIQTVNAIFVNAQPAHIMKAVGRALDAEERDVARARYIQQALGRN